MASAWEHAMLFAGIAALALLAVNWEAPTGDEATLVIGGRAATADGPRGPRRNAPAAAAARGRKGCKIAVLLVGYGFRPLPDARVMLDTLIRKSILALGDPDVFLVSEPPHENECKPEVYHKFDRSPNRHNMEYLVKRLGPRIKAIGMMTTAAREWTDPSPESTRNRTMECFRLDDGGNADGRKNVSFRNYASLMTGRHDSPDASHIEKLRAAEWLEGLSHEKWKAYIGEAPAVYQWLKVKHAWNLMEKHENRTGVKYDYVFKFRFDIAPFAIDKDSVCSNDADNVVYAATDTAFWGTRAAVENMALIWDAVDPWYRTKYPAPWSRPVHVSAVLRSYLSSNADYWSIHPVRAFRSYPKIASIYLPFKLKPGMRFTSPMSKFLGGVRQNDFSGRGIPFRWNVSDVIGELSSLFCDEGLDDYIDPNHPPTGIVMRQGPLVGSSDIKSGFLAAEGAMLYWLFSRNISICSFGLGADSILWKGDLDTWGGNADGKCVTSLDRRRVCNVERPAQSSRS